MTTMSTMALKHQQIDDIRERTLIAIGVTPEELGRLWLLSVSKLENQLEAKKIQYFSLDGQVTDQRVDGDGPLQQRAAIELNKMVSALAGLHGSRSSGEAQAPVVNLDFSGWSVQPPTPVIAPVTVEVLPE